jgi:hypothetical protein
MVNCSPIGLSQAREGEISRSNTVGFNSAATNLGRTNAGGISNFALHGRLYPEDTDVQERRPVVGAEVLDSLREGASHGLLHAARSKKLGNRQLRFSGSPW